MKIKLLILGILMFESILNGSSYAETKKTNRTELGEKKYQELIGSPSSSAPTNDPEFGQILRNFIFGEVFYTGNLSDKERELITIVNLTTLQALPQLRSHINVALNVGLTPIEIKEAVYHCTPFIGFPRTLNALNEVNQVFTTRKIDLPLKSQRTVNEENRYEKGKEIESILYGNYFEEEMKNLPANLGEDIARFKKEMAFGDFYTLSGLDIKTKALLSLSILSTIGDETEISKTTLANLKIGNTKEKMISVMIQCIPYIGFPQSVKTINIIKKLN